MRYVLMLLAAFASHSWAGQLPGGSAGDPLAESKRINEAIARLTSEYPVARQIEELRARMSDDSRAIQQQIDELSETPEWKQYQQRRRELEQQRNRRMTEEREALEEAGRKLYAGRHAELRRRAPVDLAEGRKLGFDVLSYPTIDGSTSTHPLSVIVASRLLDVPYAWRYSSPRVWFGAASIEDTKLLLPFDPDAARRPTPHDTIELNIAAGRVYAAPASHGDPKQVRTARMINSLLASHSNTHAAHVNLIEGHSDLILSARAPSGSELKLAAGKGVKLAAVPIAKDALVFLVNEQNEVKSLTRQQLRAIYEGRIGRWGAVGWTMSDEPTDSIVPLRRERDSGSRELFDELLMKGDQLPDPPDPYTVDMFETLGMSGPYNRITRWRRALGYSVYYYERYMALSPQTHAIAIDGVSPTFESIASDAYPFVAPVYAVYREDQPAGSPARMLLRWLLSIEGQAVVRESGYVPIRQGG